MYQGGYNKAVSLADKILEQATKTKASVVAEEESRSGLMSSTRRAFKQYTEAASGEPSVTKQTPDDMNADYIARLRADTEEYLRILESEGQQRPIARPSSAASTDLSTRELLAKTIQAEAGGEGYTGMLAVGAVISNRVNASGFGDSIQDVILKPGQFSAWNSVTGYAKGKGGVNMDKIKPSKDAYAAADAILSGDFESPVGGATHYYNPSIVEPKWGQDAGGDWQEIGGHVFGYASKG
jgi:spore germination cell wall hydrolase CwlJ-like protein